MDEKTHTNKESKAIRENPQDVPFKAMSSEVLPKSLPIHPKATRFLHDISVNDNTKYLQQCQRELDSTLDQIIETTLFIRGDLPLDLIQELDQTNKNLQAQYEQLKKSGKILQTAKDQYRQDSNQCQHVESLDDWQNYVTMGTNSNIHIPKSLQAHYEESVKSFETSNTPETMLDAQSKTTMILKALPQIWSDPTAVIRDEIPSADDDDLKIEGGTIDLECAITCKQFVTPMISRKCGHTFDKEGIVNYLGGPNSRTVKDCPQAGCSKSVSINDFVEDDLMKLRCKIADCLKQRQIADSDSIDVI